MIKRLPSGLSHDLRSIHATSHVPSALPNNFCRFLHSGENRANETVNSTQALVQDFNHALNKLVQKTTEGKHGSKGKTQTSKKANHKKVKTVGENLKKEDQDDFLEDDSFTGSSSADLSSSRPVGSALPSAIQQLMDSAPIASSTQQQTPPPVINADKATPAALKEYVETFCITQSPDVLLSSLRQLIESHSFPAAQIIIHQLIEREHTDEKLYEALQQTLIEICEEKRLPLFRNLMKPNPLVDARKHILTLLTVTAVKLGKNQGHVTTLKEVIALGQNEETGKHKISKLGHQKLSWQLKGLFHDRPHDLLHILDESPGLTPVVSAYVMVFSTLIISSPYVEKQRDLWEKLYLRLSYDQPIEWFISHERLLRDLSANFWGSVISRQNSPTLKELRTKVRKLPPSQAIWIEATLMADELDHANALVEAMLNEGFSATEEVGQHLVKLFTRDMDPREALDVIDSLHKQYGTYISLHTTFFSHWCRTRNSRAVLSMVKVLKARDQMTKEFYIQAFQSLLKNGDFKGAFYLADEMSRDSETSNHVTAGEFLSAALYRGRQSIYSESGTPEEVSDLMTAGKRYHILVKRFATYINKFNESRDEPTTRLPIHVTLRYLNELHKRGLYASAAWYQYNLEMMQVCALTQPEVELFLRVLSRLLSCDRCISADFDKEFADIITKSEAIVKDINGRLAKQRKGLVQEETSALTTDIVSDPVIHESSAKFADDAGTVDEPLSSSAAASILPPSYRQIFNSPYFQFETVKWGAIKSPKDPGSGVRILNMLSKETKSYVRPYVVADAIQHVATKLYISTPRSYRRLRAQTSFNMEEFLQKCESEWKTPLKWRK